ncbi:hypothetical protein F4859DRAFT_386457 [Xylaria cf. heliscus]|nr:hypothetical protein F4859DRAFT_386457 [Xylaria cf. heliscus]
MLPLSGKHCIITGGSRGIGLAIAKLFASHDAQCTLIGRHREGLEEAVRSLKGGSSAHHLCPFNVAKQDGWRFYMDNILNRGRIDVLVNAAGISHSSHLCRMDPVDIERVLDVNLKGTILGCRTVLPNMMRQRSGCIINISSLLATHGGRGASVYAASKAGVIGLTRSLAWEAGKFNIRANVIQPGYIQTDMTEDLAQNNRDLAALIPLGRLGVVEEVAEAALFLATNSYAHNCVLNIDGGLSGA